MEVAKATKIEVQRWYTMQDIVRGRMFPWVKSLVSIRTMVLADREKRKRSILKPIVKGEGRGTKYLIKGEKIIKFVKLVEAGKVKI